MSKNRIEQDDAFMREVRVGLMVLAVLVSVFLYVAFGKLSGWHEPLPLAFEVDNADIETQSPEGLTVSDRPDANGQPGPPPAETIAVSFPTEPFRVSPSVEPPRRPRSLVETSRIASSRQKKPGYSSQVSKNQLRPFPAKKTIPADDSIAHSDFAPSGNASVSSSVTSSIATSRESAGFGASSDSSGGFDPYAVQAPSIPRIIESKVRQVSATEPIPLLPEFLMDEDEIDRSSSEQDSGPVSNDLEESTDAASTAAIEDDSFWMIAQRVYGDGRYFDALYQVNKDQVPSFNELPQDTVILTPSIAELRQRFPRQCPRAKFVTRGGETLFQIAGDKLGQASRYVDLLKLNFQRLPEDVQHDTPLPAEISLELPRR